MPVDQYTPEALRERFQRLNAGCAIDRLALRDGVALTIDPASRWGFEACCLDPGLTREMNAFLHNSRHRRRLLDIGAMHGLFSLVFTARGGTEAIAVEPSAPALVSLRANCRLNPGHNIRVAEGAVGASAAVIRMRHAGVHLLGADLVRDDTEPTLVKVQPGDELLADQRFVPDTIKIDVEGYEQQVLIGLASTLDYFRPDLHVEVHGPWLPMFDGSVDGVIGLLQGHGYRLHLLDGRELEAVDRAGLRDTMFHLICIHRSVHWADQVRGYG